MINLTKIVTLALLISATNILCLQAYRTAKGQNDSIKPWTQLNADQQYSAGQSLRFYRLQTETGSRAALVVLDLNDGNFELLPFFCEHSTCLSDVINKEKALAGINGGFFNLSNGESTSYVVIAGKNQCEPRQNKSLVENPQLKPYLETILNRSELRILKNAAGKRKACIVPHNTVVPAGWTLVHSIQAGPMLLPTNTEEEEAFVRKSKEDKLIDAIGSHKQAARTAIGITPDNHILLLCIASKGQEEFSSGVTLEQLAKILVDLGCNQAINFDGGTSTTMVVAEGDYRDEANYHVSKIISGHPEKLIKSGLIIAKHRNKSQALVPDHSVHSSVIVKQTGSAYE